jgi:pSer/pThr/pTyr-binding forkhead associated (FHA) protein
VKLRIEDRELVIGREGADVNVDDQEASRRHAVVRPAGGGAEIEDLGSLNGTFVNGARIDGPTALSTGDEVRIGSTVLVVELPAAAPATVVARIQREPVAPPAQPFGVLGEPIPPRRRRIASRKLGPQVLSIAAVLATAAALVLYFGLR